MAVWSRATPTASMGQPSALWAASPFKAHFRGRNEMISEFN
jgi:hypothetical protein